MGELAIRRTPHFYASRVREADALFPNFQPSLPSGEIQRITPRERVLGLSVPQRTPAHGKCFHEAA